MNAREEGTSIELDFDKLTKIAEKGQPVVPVVLQNADTSEVLYIAYADEQALRATLETGTAVLWSTSRNELWHKGATSGDVLDVVEVRVNCEQTSLLYLVRPRRGVCHTRTADGRTRPTCYYRKIAADGRRLEPAE
jgi:phosphoribosyl-AMP cyclohydrolase